MGLLDFLWTGQTPPHPITQRPTKLTQDFLIFLHSEEVPLSVTMTAETWFWSDGRGVLQPADEVLTDLRRKFLNRAGEIGARVGDYFYPHNNIASIKVCPVIVVQEGAPGT